MGLSWKVVLGGALGVAALVGGGTGAASAAPPVGVSPECLSPIAKLQPGSPEWVARDAQEQLCATYRNRDQLLSPAFGVANLRQGGALYVQQLGEQAVDPTHPRGGLTTLVPGSKAADPFRTIEKWTGAGRGRVAPVTFKATNGSTLRGHVFAPPARVKRPKNGFPGVVITDGSVQAYEELYFWAAEDLAENGYVVMTYDVQGQGDSDLAGSDCPGACTGVPYQQDLNFFQGAEDSLSFFLSDANPYTDVVDRDRVGVAGHSLGASAVSVVGQCDKRVKTIVAWDNLRKIDGCDGVKIAPANRRSTLIGTSALALTNDYAFNPQPNVTAPDYDAKTAGFKQVRDAGFDAQIVTLRNATHLTYSYIPLALPANQLGERFASFYTLAWFDLHLKGDRSALRRLTARTYDGSVDGSSIGTGVFDPAAAVPGDPESGNVPFLVKGIAVDRTLSFLYRSAFSLKDPRTGAPFACEDQRVGGCPVADVPSAGRAKKVRKPRRRR